MPLVLEARYALATNNNLSGDRDAAEVELRATWLDAMRLGDPVWQVRVSTALADLLGHERTDRVQGEFWIGAAAAALSRIDHEHPVAWDYWYIRSKLEFLWGEFDVALDSVNHALALEGIDIIQRHHATSMALALRKIVAKGDELDVLKADAEAHLASVNAALGHTHPSAIAARSALAQILVRLGDGPGALAVLEGSEHVIERRLGRHDLRIAPLYSTRASARKITGDIEGARSDLRRVVEIRTASTPNDDRGIGLAYSNLAASLDDDQAAAVDALEYGIPRLEAGYGPDHVNTLSARATLGTRLIQLERHDDAEVELDRVAELAPEGSAVQGLVALNRSRVALARGEADRAVAFADAATALIQSNFGPEHPMLSAAREARARAQSKRAAR